MRSRKALEQKDLIRRLCFNGVTWLLLGAGWGRVREPDSCSVLIISVGGMTMIAIEVGNSDQFCGISLCSACIYCEKL